MNSDSLLSDTARVTNKNNTNNVLFEFNRKQPGEYPDRGKWVKDHDQYYQRKPVTA